MSFRHISRGDVFCPRIARVTSAEELGPKMAQERLPLL